ncbi:uncharacterized F-box/LRR-repeat protein C02F5.7-like [Dendronephthya gigantea]|uniref:uncharacterized F-box/LRR-repeat protein C02F5.7-like n=1 Tax=Dendronephthya gigantea TaxID=151771 RepID=UPI00106A4F53|nr:uncharacterized F-box/LRR-repeat protein C02F5.7-like [Dendronephthya gigantea]
MEVFPESVVLKIFSYLSTGELVRVSRVNSEWQRIAHDWQLWRVVNLAKYSKNIDDLTLRKLVRSSFKAKLKYLDLTRFNISTGTLHLIKITSSAIETLILKYATFCESQKNFPEISYFPHNLKALNIAQSTGPTTVYRNIIESLGKDTLESLVIGDEFLELFTENKLNFLNFFQRQRLTLEALEFSFCKELTDDWLKQILICCKNLRFLCVRRCRRVEGEFLRFILDICPFLRTLICDGIKISDENFKVPDWSRCMLVELDLSRCRCVTEDGLLSMLPKLKFLRYLSVSCCGYGHALTDKVLKAMAGKSWKFLETLDVSFSCEITCRPLEAFVEKCPNLSKISKTNCPKLWIEVIPPD